MMNTSSTSMANAPSRSRKVAFGSSGSAVGSDGLVPARTAAADGPRGPGATGGGGGTSGGVPTDATSGGTSYGDSPAGPGWPGASPPKDGVQSYLLNASSTAS